MVDKKEFDFHEDLSYCQLLDKKKVFDDYYWSQWPNDLFVIKPASYKEQLRGIDRTLIFKDFSKLMIDEKADRFRRPNIFIELEYVATHKPSWFFTSESDYILYAYPDGEAYFLPVIPSRIVWAENEKEWRSKYPTHTIYNKGYAVLGIGIPQQLFMNCLDKVIKRDHFNYPLWDRVKYVNNVHMPENITAKYQQIVYNDKLKRGEDPDELCRGMEYKHLDEKPAY